MTASQPSESPASSKPRRSGGWAEALHRTLERVRDEPAALAACRRGLGKAPMDVPAMWQYIVPALDAVPEARPERRRAVEAACQNALALYAVHQQSRADPMHRRSADGRQDSVGRACRELLVRLSRKGRPVEGVTRRFLAAATADSADELTGHLRGLIPLLRENEIALDYARLALDLADWTDPDGRARARRRWGLDFYRARDQATDMTEHEENADALA